MYNRRELVARALESVSAQTFTDWELIVVDDASTDGTWEYLRSAWDRAPVRLLRQRVNSGVSAARNTGIGAARGDWIALLDSDDEWKPPKLEKQMAALAESGLAVCHTDEIWIRNGVRVNPHKHHAKHGGRIFLHALPRCVISPSSILLQRAVFDAVGLFDESLPACEDYELFLRLTCRCEVLYLEEKLTVKYGGHPDQLSRAHPAMDRFRVRALDRLLKDAAAPLTAEERAAARDTLVRKAAIVRGRRGQARQSRPAGSDGGVPGALGGRDFGEGFRVPFLKGGSATRTRGCKRHGAITLQPHQFLLAEPGVESLTVAGNPGHNQGNPHHWQEERYMYFVVFATHREGMGQERLRLRDGFAAYLHDHPDHPGVIVHHGGPTLGDDGETVNGLLLAVEAPSLEAARAFVADSPYGQAGLFAESHVRPWNWLTGRPG